MDLSLATLTPWIVTTAVVVIVAAIGGFATKIGAWYYSLKQPQWSPPDWLFGPAWTIIYLLSISAVVFTWNAAPPGPARRWLLIIFGLNALLNALWSVVFFSFKRPDWAFIEIVFLWLSTLSMLLVSINYSTTAALLLLVYLGWVSFAALLNSAVVRLNRPFGSQYSS